MTSIIYSSDKLVVHSLFQKYDDKNHGYIGESELKALSMDLGLYMDSEAIKSAVRILDRDGNGTINFEEFFLWWKMSDKFKKIRIS